MKGLVWGIVAGSASEHAEWTAQLIPRSGSAQGPCSTALGKDASRSCASDGGDEVDWDTDIFYDSITGEVLDKTEVYKARREEMKLI